MNIIAPGPLPGPAEPASLVFDGSDVYKACCYVTAAYETIKARMIPILI